MSIASKIAFYEKMLEALKDGGWLITVANGCAKAYAEKIEKPDWYKPFGSEEPELVARNLAGLQAVVSGICSIVSDRELTGCKEESCSPEAVLNDIISRKCSGFEQALLIRFADCAYGAGQPFRTDKGVLNCMTEMKVFDLLPPDERAKYFCQVKTAGKMLLEKL